MEVESTKSESIPGSETDSNKTLLVQDETRFQKFVRGIKLMTIEPALLIHMTAAFMGNLMVQDLIFERACHVNLGYSKDVCKSRGKALEEEVQEITSTINIWRTTIDNAFPVICVLFLGAWSDIYGRKFPLLLAMFGYILRYIGLLLCVYFPSLNAQMIALISSLPVALTGGRTAISMTIYSYITDTTSLKDRTLRTGILTAVRTFGKSLGSTLGGNMRRAGVPYVTIFGVGGGLDVIAFGFTIFFMRNTRKGNLERSTKRCGIITDIFNFNNIISSAKAFFRKRDKGIRFRMYLIVVALLCTMIPMQAEESLLYGYTRLKLGWDSGKYGDYQSFRMVVAFIGGIFSLGILSHGFKMSDAAIGVVSCFSQIASSFVYAFANSGFLMFLAPIIDILNGTMLIACRSMISKIVPQNEIGKVNSFIGTLDSLTPLPASPIYSALYKGTLTVFPGAIFLVSAALTIPPLLIFSWIGVTDSRKEALENLEPESGKEKEAEAEAEAEEVKQA